MKRFLAALLQLILDILKALKGSEKEDPGDSGGEDQKPPKKPRDLEFPFEKNKDFLDLISAAGIRITTPDPDVLAALAADTPFPDRQIDLGTIALHAQGGKDVRLGRGGASVVFTAGAQAFSGMGVFPDPDAMLAQLRPERDISPGISFPRDDRSHYLMMRWGYDLQASAKGGLALQAGTLTLSADGRKAGAFAVIRRLPRSAGARSSVAAVVNSWMLPKQVRSVHDLDPGTWLIAEIDGSFGATLGVRFGYDFNWVREVEAGGLRGDIGLRLQVGIGAALGFSSEGRYAVALSRASMSAQDKVLRLRIFKLSLRGWSFGFNAGVTLKPGVGLPAGSDDFIQAVFGVHGLQVLQDLKSIVKWTGIDKKLADRLASLSVSYMGKFLKQVTGIDPETAFNEARSALLGFLEAWEKLPHRVASLLWKFVERNVDLKPLRSLLQSIVDADQKSLARLLKSSLESVDFFRTPAGQLLLALVEEGILGPLTNTRAFKSLQKAAAALLTVLDGSAFEALLVRLQQAISQRLNLDQVKKVVTETDFEDMDEWLKAKLAAFIHEKINFGKIGEISRAIEFLIDNRQKLYDKALKALHRRYEFDLSATYQKTTRNTALFDIDFDFSQAGSEVQAMLRDALEGNFDQVLVKRVPGVRLNVGTLTHGIDRGSHVEVSLPFFKKSRSHLNKVLAQVNAVQQEGDRVLVYELEAQDDVSLSTARMKRHSALSVGGTWKQGLGNEVRVYDEGALTYSYSFRQAKRDMSRTEVQAQLKPYVTQYFPGSFSSSGGEGPKASFDTWIADLDEQVERLEHNGRDNFGDTLISLQLSLPSQVASAWVRAPEKQSKLYFDMSRRLQTALKRLIPFYYFQDPRKYGDLAAAAPLMVYSAIPASTTIRVSGDKITLNTDRDIYWNWPQQQQRSIMARLKETAVNLSADMQRAHDVLLATKGLEEKARFYEPGPVNYERILNTVLNRTAGRALLRALVSLEAKVVKGAFEAGVQMAKFREQSSQRPSKAIRALAKFGSQVTSTFNDRIKSIYGGGAIRPLGTMVFVEAAQTLGSSDDARSIVPSAMLSLIVLKESSEFQPDDFLQGTLPEKSQVVVEQRLVHMGANTSG